VLLLGDDLIQRAVANSAQKLFLDDVGTNAKQGRRSEIIHLADANCDRFK